MRTSGRAGTMGLQVPGFFTDYSKTSYYYLFLVVTVLFLILIYRIIHSEMGLDLPGRFE